jgi:hypothetical protein
MADQRYGAIIFGAGETAENTRNLPKNAKKPPLSRGLLV